MHDDQVVQLLTIAGETIVTTPNHPFYTSANQWVPAGQLHPGDLVRRADGTYGMVEATTFVYQPQPMYNLTVAAVHTYFVGDGQWLVHNAKCQIINTSQGPLLTSQSKGDTRLFVQRTWYKGTFNTELDTAAYHLNKHASGFTIQDYTQEAQDFYRSNWRSAQEVMSNDGTIMLHRIRTQDGFGIFTQDGRVVTFEPF